MTKRNEYKGILIEHDGFRWFIRNMPWGSEGGEYPRFKTLTAAKSFIDRNITDPRYR